MNEQVEWLKAQVEAYLKDTKPTYENDVVLPATLDEFVKYIEEKFAFRGLLDR